jgi:hypothetical protein
MFLPNALSSARCERLRAAMQGRNTSEPTAKQPALPAASSQ